MYKRIKEGVIIVIVVFAINYACLFMFGFTPGVLGYDVNASEISEEQKEVQQIFDNAASELEKLSNEIEQSEERQQLIYEKHLVSVYGSVERGMVEKLYAQILAARLLGQESEEEEKELIYWLERYRLLEDTAPTKENFGEPMVKTIT